MTVTTYVISASGKATIDRDPNSRLQYGIDLQDVLLEMESTLVSVVGLPVGVTIDGAAEIDGEIVKAWVLGGDAEAEANSLTFRFTCADGSIDDRTVYFKIKEK